uniref:Uncharacterized protein n=1 Tax=Anguilla anguilla TaxID=7936 RepID=A0A0E9XL11_ANGAN
MLPQASERSTLSHHESRAGCKSIVSPLRHPCISPPACQGRSPHHPDDQSGSEPMQS